MEIELAERKRDYLQVIGFIIGSSSNAKVAFLGVMDFIGKTVDRTDFDCMFEMFLIESYD